jgi:murein DD-endopeptidase MepM/ murein hydrolase activator NlpD
MRAFWLVSAVAALWLSGPAGAAAPIVERPAVAWDGVAVAAGPTPRRAVPVGAYRWPLDGAPVVVRPFDPPRERWLAGHRGVDLAATPGVVVRAAGAGVVAFAGTVAGRGVVSVQHPDGLRTTYEPVEPQVLTGQAVAPGDPLGSLRAGHPGCAAAACLHWGLRRGDQYVDPLTLLGYGRMRLLPLGGVQEAGEPFGEPLVLVGPVVHLRGQP